MNESALILGGAILLGFWMLANACSRAAVAIDAAIGRNVKALTEIQLAQRTHTTAVVAGILLGHRLGSASYDRIISNNTELQQKAFWKSASVLLDSGSSEENIKTSKALQQLSEDLKNIVAHHDVFGEETQAEYVTLARRLVSDVSLEG